MTIYNNRFRLNLHGQKGLSILKNFCELKAETKEERERKLAEAEKRLKEQGVLK